MQFFREILKTYLGPTLIAAVIIYGYWSWNTIKMQRAALDQMIQVLTGQCRVVLEQQGFAVTKGEEKSGESDERQ